MTDGWPVPLPALVAGLYAVVGLALGCRGLVTLRRGWLARRHTATLLTRWRWAQAVVVGREPGTAGARVADLRPVVRFTDADGAVVTAVADLPVARRPVAQPLRTGNRVSVAYDDTSPPAVEVLTAGSDGPVGGLMTRGMAAFSGGVVLILCGAGTYVTTSVVLIFTP
ncbi:MAG TPA: DUF3592 domain-containing protein [Pilimelia sp.]|nr:DUF3592 domain-containing protein [Pilimelia sp.]